jgi:hypothetical protein
MFAHAAVFLVISLVLWGAFLGIRDARHMWGFAAFIGCAVILSVSAVHQLGVFSQVWATGYYQPVKFPPELILSGFVGLLRVVGVFRG